LRCPNAKATLTGTIGDCVQPQSREIAISLCCSDAKQVTRRGVRKVYLLLPWKSLFRGE
jgi:hypothetical protein